MPWPTPGFSCWPMIRMYSAVTTVMAMKAENVMVMAAGDVTVMEMAPAGSRNPTKKRKKMEMLLSSGTEAAFFSCVSTVLSLQ